MAPSVGAVIPVRTSERRRCTTENDLRSSYTGTAVRCRPAAIKFAVHHSKIPGTRTRIALQTASDLPLTPCHLAQVLAANQVSLFLVAVSFNTASCFSPYSSVSLGRIDFACADAVRVSWAATEPPYSSRRHLLGPGPSHMTAGTPPAGVDPHASWYACFIFTSVGNTRRPPLDVHLPDSCL